ncbi:MAG: TlpA family protein disulfide reductase [Thermomicrobiales bacterium]|nr:MAG: TlpA family protein disulfide reductase [Thermomicrobiales bacterium]
MTRLLHKGPPLNTAGKRCGQKGSAPSANNSSWRARRSTSSSSKARKTGNNKPPDSIWMRSRSQHPPERMPQRARWSFPRAATSSRSPMARRKRCKPRSIPACRVCLDRRTAIRRSCASERFSGRRSLRARASWVRQLCQVHTGPPGSGHRIGHRLDRLERMATGRGSSPCRGLDRSTRAELDARTAGRSTISNQDLAGRAVVLNFWASWCAPCEEEMPALEQVSAELMADGAPATIVGVGVKRDNNENALAMVDRLGVTYPIGRDTGGTSDTIGPVTQAFGVDTFPATVFIRPDGTVSAIVFGPLTEDSTREYIESALES